MSTLSDAAKEQLSIYDKSIYVEPDCVDSATPLPVHCNQMNLGQECRGCYLTCEGARKYIEDFAGEIDEWVSAAAFFFLCVVRTCPWDNNGGVQVTSCIRHACIRCGTGWSWAMFAATLTSVAHFLRM